MFKERELMRYDIRIGIIGLGGRGSGMLKDPILSLGVQVAAVCDTREERMRNAADIIKSAGLPEPRQCEDYHDVLAMPGLDAVIIAASWEEHVPMACDAMRAGKYVGLEVGGAYSVEDCWKLVRTYEETKVPCMMLENCCYGREELLVLNMVRQGLFGEIVHCEGGYRHDQRKSIVTGPERGHYRYRQYLNRNGDSYPTHALGPIANVLDINHGNRMISLVSMASKAAGIHDYILRTRGQGDDMTKWSYSQGDVVTTMIKCAHGETIVLCLDTGLPRFYTRCLQVEGTRGMYMYDDNSIFIDGKDDENEFRWRECWNNAEAYYERYEHPVWREYLEKGVTGGHGGMDGLVYKAFFDAVRNRGPVPIDVYDTASWMAITPLSEESIALGGMPRAIPDFTNGQWMLRGAWEP